MCGHSLCGARKHGAIQFAKIRSGILWTAVIVCAACTESGTDPGRPEPVGVVTASVTYRPPECSAAVDAAIHRAAARYRIPRWFYYAVVHRESTFNPNAVNSGDGGVGLTQLTGADHQGRPFPENLPQPDNTYTQWIFDMGLNVLGPWIDMKDVSRLDAPFDPAQNLDRFSSGYAAPAFFLFKSRYHLSDTETLRAVAYHWNKGLPYDASRNYNPSDQTYLPLYDQYVATYRPPVEADDGVWTGTPATPPYSSVSSGASYDFESGGIEGWSGVDGIITSAAASAARAFHGAWSLAVGVSGAPGGLNQVHVNAGALPGAGAVVTFHVWVPAGSSLSAVQAYVQQGAGGNWHWTGDWRSISELTLNAWNTFTVTVPPDAVIPLAAIGVELSTSGAWNGTVYLDTVTW